MTRLVVLLAVVFVPASAFAQPVVPPAGPHSAVSRIRAAAELASRDRRGALELLADDDPYTLDEPRIELAREAVRARLDPMHALRFDASGARALLRDLASIGAARTAGIVVGVFSAITGAASVVLVIASFLATFDCTALLGFVPACGPTGVHPGVMTGAAVAGGTALGLAFASIVMLADAGSRHGTWVRRLEGAPRVGASITDQGGYLEVAGTF